MIKEAIILAGGLGTRMKDYLPDIPKQMADINGTPLLELMLRYLERQKINRIILSVGYRHEVIQEHFKNQFGRLRAITIFNNSLYISTSNKDGRGNVRKGDDKIIKIELRDISR